MTCVPFQDPDRVRQFGKIAENRGSSSDLRARGGTGTPHKISYPESPESWRNGPKGVAEIFDTSAAGGTVTATTVSAFQASLLPEGARQPPWAMARSRRPWTQQHHEPGRMQSGRATSSSTSAPPALIRNEMIRPHAKQGTTADRGPPKVTA
jgi:hypothetical protein